MTQPITNAAHKEGKWIVRGEGLGEWHGFVTALDGSGSRRAFWDCPQRRVLRCDGVRDGESDDDALMRLLTSIVLESGLEGGSVFTLEFKSA